MGFDQFNDLLFNVFVKRNDGIIDFPLTDRTDINIVHRDSSNVFDSITAGLFSDT